MNAYWLRDGESKLMMTLRRLHLAHFAVLAESDEMRILMVEAV